MQRTGFRIVERAKLRFQRDIEGVPALSPGARIASLRGRIFAREELLDQSEGDSERLGHERAIAAYEAEIARIESAGIESGGAR